jgi:hypothetical protein
MRGGGVLLLLVLVLGLAMSAAMMGVVIKVGTSVELTGAKVRGGLL